MEATIYAQEKKVRKLTAETLEVSQRDLVKEKYEASLRTQTQERKANAITHLEPVLVGMC